MQVQTFGALEHKPNNLSTNGKLNIVSCSNGHMFSFCFFSNNKYTSEQLIRKHY